MKTYFKNLLDPTIIIFIVIFLLVGVILFILFKNKVPEFKQKYRSKYIVYLLASLLIFAVFTFLGYSKAITSLFGTYVFYQVVALILGSIHVVIYRYYLEKFEKENRWLEILFNLIILLFAAIPFLLVYTFINTATYSLYMASALLVFMIPTWVYVTFNAAVSIPAKIYKTWVFPLDDAFPEPMDDEFKDLIVVTFIFSKTPDSQRRTEFRAKSPIRMDFGRLFYHFVYDYNDRNAESPIENYDADGNPQHWVFYLKPKWYGMSKYIDPDLPMYMNGVEENSVIICQRTSPQEKQAEEEDSTEME